jgi:glucoamylase
MPCKNWSPNNALALAVANYPTWSSEPSVPFFFCNFLRAPVTVTLPASTNFEYKYIRKESNGDVTWESDPNNSQSTPATGSSTINDTWRYNSMLTSQ